MRGYIIALFFLIVEVYKYRTDTEQNKCQKKI